MCYKHGPMKHAIKLHVIDESLVSEGQVPSVNSWSANTDAAGFVEDRQSFLSEDLLGHFYGVDDAAISSASAVVSI